MSLTSPQRGVHLAVVDAEHPGSLLLVQVVLRGVEAETADRVLPHVGDVDAEQLEEAFE